MSSFNDQAEYLRKKKEEILAKKKAQASNTNTSVKPAPVPFANDGSFLEKFKAMQKSQQIKKEPVEESRKQSKPHVSTKQKQPTSSSTMRVQPLQKPATIFVKEEPVDSTSSSDTDYELARELAEKVHKEGVQAEMMARIQGRNDPRYRFLFDDKSPVGQYYQTQLQNLKTEKLSPQSIASTSHTQPSSAPAQASETPAGLMSEFEKAKALVRAKAAAMMKGGPAAIASAVTEEEKRRQKEKEEQKMMNEIYMKVIQQQMAAASEVSRKRKRKKDKPKYEYDSDEDTEGGTWEHKKRQSEMQKTAEKALELTENAKGKHHISDFLPPDELEKFIEKVKAVKEGREADFSDYAKFKISEDNVGYKMLQKAGWQEGTGLGAKGEGITAPINKGKTSFDNSGIGAEKVADVKKEDDDFEVYRKRMMLAYKFRPNPLNNPRRPYYE